MPAVAGDKSGYEILAFWPSGRLSKDWRRLLGSCRARLTTFPISSLDLDHEGQKARYRAVGRVQNNVKPLCNYEMSVFSGCFVFPSTVNGEAIAVVL